MRREIKIVLPPYKLLYSFCFIFILSFVRGVSFSNEIGIALEGAMGILAVVVCADTYVMEIVSKRWEVGRLHPLPNRVCSQYKRMAIQIVFLWFLAVVGYGLFWLVQQPLMQSEVEQFFIYTGSIVITISFWGILSNIVGCLWRNMWVGIGGSILLWLGVNSKGGDQLLGKWNVFSYTFRDIGNPNDYSWLCGKGITIISIVLLLILLPLILKKRG